jgi:hypothetical protein
LPAALTTIGDDAFEKCSMLQSVKLPVAVTSIGSDAFYECTMLAKVELSVALKKIGGSAFAKCPSLRDVIVNSPAPPAISRSTFKDVVSCTFWLPKSCKPLYMANKDWVKVYVLKEKE